MPFHFSFINAQSFSDRKMYAHRFCIYEKPLPEFKEKAE